MPFPRFTSGRTGNLTFSLLNEMMERIEAVERSAGANPMKLPGQLPPFLARVVSVNPANSIEYEFEEVAYPTSHSISSPIVVSGGRTSRQEANLYAFPLIGSGLAIGQVVFAFPVYDQDSGLVFHTVQSAAGSAIMAKVTSNIVLQANVRWRYVLTPQKIININPLTYDSAGGAITAYNGAENVLDANPVYGVGAKPPGGTYIRQPIRNDVIVSCVQDTNGFWNFCVPNGYEVVCP